MYTYIKGKGWVEEGEERIVTMKCGTRVRIENRKPNPGEAWDCAGTGQTNLLANNYAEWAEIAATLEYEGLTYPPGEQTVDLGLVNNYLWVTFVKVD